MIKNIFLNFKCAVLFAVSSQLVIPFGIQVQAQSAQTSPVMPAGIERVTAVEGITEYKMPNGLRVLIFPDQSKQTMTVNITYLVGSRHENYGETGMAHLLEHMTFKGSPKHPRVWEELSARGARGNASTWYDRTNYFRTFAANDSNLEWMIELEADRMINSYIKQSDLDSEMSVVRNEFESGENDPGSVLTEKTAAAAYQWHNYGNTTIGARADIENVPAEKLKAFYKTYYQPDNAVLLVAGKIDETKTLNFIHKYFSAIPRPVRPLPKLYTTEPVQDGERSVVVRRAGDMQLVQAMYHVPPGSHPDYAAVEILVRILSATPSGRLHKVLVETKKASSVQGGSLPLKDSGMADFTATVRQDASLDAARIGLLESIESFASTPPTKDEVDRARTVELKRIELALNSTEITGITLSEWIAQGDWRLFFLHRDRLESVTAEDVKRVATRYLKESNRTLGMFVPTAKPDRAEIPPAPDTATLLRDYKGKAAVAAGEAFDPSPANIEARTVRITTPNGLKIALLTKETRGDSVNAALMLHFGDEKSLLNRGTIASLTGAMLMRGTKTKTRQQIQDEFNRLKARISVSGGASSAIASIETTRENLPAVLRLVNEILRDPAFDAVEFEQLKQERLAGIEASKSEPQAIVLDAFNRHFNKFPKSDTRGYLDPHEQIAKIKAATLDEVKRFHAEFYGASNGQMAVVGDFEPKEISALSSQLFGGWKSPLPYSRLKFEYKDTPAASKSFETPDKANAFFFAGMNLNLRDDHSDAPALILGNYMLGTGSNSRLFKRIRNQDGLSYAVGSQLDANSLDNSSSFFSFAIYAPQNVEKLEIAFKEEIALALKEGFTSEEVAAAKSGYLQSRQVSRTLDAALAGKLATYLSYNRTLEWDAAHEQKINALTAQQIVEAMRRHIDPSKLSIFKAGDFAKNPAK